MDEGIPAIAADPAEMDPEPTEPTGWWPSLGLWFQYAKGTMAIR